MLIVSVSTSSEPWFIGYGRGAVFFGRSWEVIMRRYWRWLSANSHLPDAIFTDRQGITWVVEHK